MTDGVSTRLQKDLEKVDARIDEKLDKFGEKIRNDLFAELHHAMSHFNSDVDSLKQLLQKSGDDARGKSIPAVVEMASSDHGVKLTGSNSVMGNSSQPAMVMSKVGEDRKSVV